MEYVLLAMIVLIVIVAVVASRLADNSFPFPFNRKETLFTNAEKTFQLLLEHALGENYRVINRVRLSDLVSIRNGVSKRTSDKAYVMANTKYVDFVICDKDNLTPKGVIDLVNTSGKGYKVTKDWFVAGALEASNIPHIRIKVKSGYSIEEIRQCVNQLILGGKLDTPKYAGTRIPAPLLRARPKKVEPVETKTGISLPAPTKRPELAHIPH
jgi:type II secretory pathway pseudopilin PulG